ncbi:uncharacterized protein LOC134538524 [Bacillus rossius redtenbacheri]|uniref:uncharacterized protein LOC134538524 n=1 Tax=Bacillus rossius redtenbacheri TaxID=93214 RepID=UPI002FDCCE65
MDTINSLCIFCGKELEGGTVIVTKGIQTIIDASLSRKDNLHEKLEGKTNVRVHSVCRQNYTRPTSIKAAIALTQSSDVQLPTSSCYLRSSEEKFDFKSNCFICGKTAIVDLKVPLERRVGIHQITTLEIKENFLRKCDERNDEWSERVRARLLSVNDLVSPEARYHRNCHTNFSKIISPKGPVGRPKCKFGDSFAMLCEHIENSDECQYTISEIKDILKKISGQEETYSDKHITNLLRQHFKERLVVSCTPGRKNVFCLSETVNKIMDEWYRDRESDPATERLRIVLAAADIIKEDIQKMMYDSQTYPNVNEIRSGGENLVPDSLKVFMQRVTKKKNTVDSKAVSRKCAVINHAVISTVRPRSFLSPIQTSLALTLHRLYGSKHLIDLLSSMGVCVSYHEASIYMNSLINAGSPQVNEEAFIQYVFDNADINIRTLDGLNTFHAMGGIQCITPSASVETHIQVERITSGKFNKECIRLCSYPKRNSRCGFKAIILKDFNELKSARSLINEPSNILFPLNWMWLAGTKVQQGWNGFMNTITSHMDDCKSSYIMGVPFINLNPSNPSTIFTALCFAAEQCKKRNQTCIVTFDQPLFLKAFEIVSSAEGSSDISKIVLRLGGFHLLMSFMGSIGRIMEGSGLESLWAAVYGQTTVNHMLNGCAYSRCIRAYTLTASAIINVMRNSFDDFQNAIIHLENISKQLLLQETEPEEMLRKPDVTCTLQKLNDSLKNIQSTSRTAKLWVNLLNCIDLILQFIFAERSGNWDLHLNTTIEMLPYFHAAGHLPYAKSAHLYVQEMIKLHTKLSEKELDLFVNNGMFTIRRSGKFWSGTWSDMCIEQCLMRPMKAVGGLTHGRGITDSTLSKWILGTPFYLKVHEAVEEFLGTSISYSEQHVELRESRKTRDLADVEKFTSWLQEHNPFSKFSGELVSLSSGLVSDDSVDCDQAYEKGVAAMENMKGKNFQELKLHRKNMVKTQAMQKSVNVRSKQVIVNSQQLFNRILCVCDSPTKLKSYLEYELAPRPPSLFDAVSLRKGAKSKLMKHFEEGIVNDLNLSDAAIVLDGGFLLHCILWPKNCTYGDIMQSYCTYVLTKYGENTTVVFDGYPEDSTTKQEEQNRRYAKKSSCDITFDDNTKCVTGKEEFLSNKKNKTRMITSLASELKNKGLETFISEGDADIDIVNLAIKKLSTFAEVVVCGSDTDLAVLLTALAPEKRKMYFCKHKGGENPVTVFYDIATLTEKFKHTRKLLLFTHALTGCDTTSCFFGVGKNKATEMLKSPEAEKLARTFIAHFSTKTEILVDGEKFVLGLYGLSKYSHLNETRYYRFSTLTKKSALRSNFDLAKLPPTSEACREHLLRVYLQVQTWLGNRLSPTEWGWEIEVAKKNGCLKKTLKPTISSKPFAPNDLLFLVSCSCKLGCGNYCRCRKSNLQCTAMCENCSGLSCYNSPGFTNENTDDSPYNL